MPRPKYDSIERRLSARPIAAERREEGEGEEAEEALILRGYAALFNTPTVIWDWFTEELAPGAFAGALEGTPDIRALWNHDMREVLGRTTAGTLELAEDDIGLAVKIHLPDTERGRSYYESVRRGDVTQMSFSFRATKEEWTEEEGEMPRRRVIECELFEVSPVTFPAYQDTEISARSAAKAVLDARRRPAARAAYRRLQALVRLASAE